MPFQHASLSSSALTSATYDDETRELSVMFHSGRSYTHPGVPQEVFDQLRQAPSPGAFYNQQIKGVYG